MKALFIRIFALTLLTNSILVFGASSPGKDDKTPAASSPPAATAPQSSEDQHCDTKVRKEKKMKKKTNEQKPEDNYPGYGIFG
ncbi:MAG TPA: hypothetical protein VJW20_14690 [Candidatus Angelobacter sp.]|nr:hypothetical protein [Candidatus Angelobacter sp.]